MDNKKVVITAFARTPWCRPGGRLERFMASDLVAQILPSVMERSGIRGEEVDQTIFGQSRPTTMPSNLGHYAWLQARLPEEVPGYTVQSISGSALQAIRNAYYLIASSNAEICVAGGADSYSAAPFVIRNARNHFTEADRVIIDTLKEAEECTQSEPLSRIAVYEEMYPVADEEQSAAYRKTDMERAGAYEDSSIVPVTYTDKKKGEIVIDKDDLDEGNSALLARNADGAAALVLMSEEKAKEKGTPILAVIEGFAVAGSDYHAYPAAGVAAAKKLMDRHGVSVDAIRAAEIMENSAADASAISAELGLSDRFNMKGGALSYGLNDGAEGGFMLSRLTSALQSGERGLCCLYSPGGIGIAALVRRN